MDCLCCLRFRGDFFYLKRPDAVSKGFLDVHELRTSLNSHPRFSVLKIITQCSSEFLFFLWSTMRHCAVAEFLETQADGRPDLQKGRLVQCGAVTDLRVFTWRPLHWQSQHFRLNSTVASSFRQYVGQLQQTF